MAKLYTARQAGELLGLPHLEIIRRLRRDDIEGKKLGWNWVISEEALNKAKESTWYLRHLARNESAE